MTKFGLQNQKLYNFLPKTEKCWTENPKNQNYDKLLTLKNLTICLPKKNEFVFTWNQNFDIKNQKLNKFLPKTEKYCTENPKNQNFDKLLTFKQTFYNFFTLKTKNWTIFKPETEKYWTENPKNQNVDKLLTLKQTFYNLFTYKLNLFLPEIKIWTIFKPKTEKCWTENPKTPNFDNLLTLKPNFLQIFNQKLKNVELKTQKKKIKILINC